MITLEQWIRSELDKLESNHEYSVATDSVRAWIDLYHESKGSDDMYCSQCDTTLAKKGGCIRSDCSIRLGINKGSLWSLRTPKNYSEDSGCREVVWKDIFMPFDVVCGVDGCPPDNEDYDEYKKTHWWVCPRTRRDVCNVHDISMFIELPKSKEFEKLEDAIEYCLNWRKEWLNNELAKNE